MLLLPACAPAPQAGPCGFEPLAQMKPDMSHGLPRVPVAVNGQKATMLFDTGANTIAVTAEAGQRFGAVEEAGARFTSIAIGGRAQGRGLRLARVEFAGTVFEDQTAAELTVPLDSFGLPALDGILGTSVLGHFDLELDGRSDTLTVYRARICPGGKLPWREPYASVPIARPRPGGFIRIPLLIDGHPVLAVIDTGASHSMLDIRVAARLGVPQTALAPERGFAVQGLGPQLGRAWRHRFDRLVIGDTAYGDAELAIADMGGQAEMLLGQDFLRGRQVWISVASGVVHIARPAADLRSSPRAAR
jgi:predicted aspartyl protease